MSDDLVVTIPDWALLTWESQVRQFPKVGKPGLVYERHCACSDCARSERACDEAPVDCLVYRNRKGHVVGLLYHYPVGNEYEKEGNVNTWVRPDRQRRGIGTALHAEAAKRWTIDYAQQSYTAAGAAFVAKLRDKA